MCQIYVYCSGIAIRRVRLSTKWERYWVRMAEVPEKAKTIRGNIKHLARPGTIWADAAQLEIGPAPSSYRPSDADAVRPRPLPPRSVELGVPYGAVAPSRVLGASGGRVPYGIDEARRCVTAHGSPILPFGMWGVPREHLQAVAADGFDYVVANPRWLLSPKTAHADAGKAAIEAYLKEAGRLRMRVGLETFHFGDREWLAWERNSIRHLFNQRLAASLAGNSTLLTWHLASGIRSVPGDVTRRAFEMVKGLDAGHPVVIHLVGDETIATALARYARSTDLASVQCEPIPDRPVKSVADIVDLVRRSSGTRPIQCAIQAGGRLHRHREPTPAELRAMSYLALVHGARLLLYYQYLPMAPSVWAALRSLSLEVKTLAPILLGTSPDDAQTRAVRDGVHVLGTRAGGKAYVLAVNTLPSDARVTIRFPLRPAAARAQVLFEGRQVDVSTSVLSDAFGPYDCHVYEIAMPGGR